MNEFLLYSTLGCHLCEQAQQLIQQLPAAIEFKTIEIADSDALVEQYGVRIPVLKSTGTGAELGWPFGLGELEEWVERHGVQTR